VPPSAASRNLSFFAVPLLSGLLLVIALALVGGQKGGVQRSVDLVLTSGFQQYIPGNGQRLGAAPLNHREEGAGTVGNPGHSLPAMPDWACSLQLSLPFLVWLTLAGLYIFRASLVLAGSLIWIGGMLSGSIGLLIIKGWYISPALPLLSSVLLYLFFSGLGYARKQLVHSQWLHRRDALQQKVFEALAMAVENRDPDIGGHIVRMRNYVRALTDRLVRSGVYTDVLTPEYRDLLVHLCPLHDIGKAAIRDAILLKPERLTEEEFAEMQRHVEYGESILVAAVGKTEGILFALSRDIIGSHHEKWDGSGYPRGIGGEEIPLAGRILAVADVYDALISKRCYKEAYSHEQSRAILMKGRGTWFDPAIADAFKDIEEEMWRISLTHSDTADSSEGARP
jgi:adenylate cyclase